MTSSDSEDRRALLQEKTIEEVVNFWYTYNQLFKAANCQRHLGRGISVSTALLGGILTYGLIWDGISNSIMIGLAVLISVLSALRSALRPSEKQRNLRAAAHEYKNLCDEARLLLQLDFADDALTNDELEKEVRELDRRRRELNKETPDVSSIWYHYIKYRKSSNGLAEVSVSDEERALVMGQDP